MEEYIKPRKIITEETKNKIKEFYLSKPMSLGTVAEKFNLCKPTISKILVDIPKYTKALINNPNLIDNFFENIDTEEKAYFLGLLISDGNVFDYNQSISRTPLISITLQEQDKYILEKFKQTIGTDRLISGDGRGCYYIGVSNKKIAEDLSKYGVVPRKSFYTYLPKNISDTMMPHLLRGIFDGDGSIRATETIEKDGRHRFAHYVGFCGSHLLMEDISLYLYKKLELETFPTVYDYKDRQLSDIKLQRINDIYKYGEWQYKNATIFLHRKKDKYDYFKERYNLE